jgi:cobalt-zinc-cadmium efflux system membrane fusion protein
MRALAALALATLVALAACGRGHDAADAADAGAPGRFTPAQLAFLKFATVEEVSAPDVASLSGTIEFDEEHTARLAPAVGGRVTELLVQVGDRVAADQPLVVMESPEVKAAEADYVAAQADLTVAEKTSDRAGRLRAAGAIADKDFLQATEDLKKAQATFERARAQLDLLHVAPGERTTRYVLRAPFAGTVVERKGVLGMEARADGPDPLVVVSDLSQVRVVVRVPDRQLALVRPGEAVAVHVDAYPDEFTGTVAAVGDVLDDATRTVPARCVLANLDGKLKPAMFARVTVKAAPGTRFLAVPTNAVVSDGERFRVVVRAPDGTLAMRPVEVGAEAGGHVQVLSGLAVGDEIVTDGALFAARELGDS